LFFLACCFVPENNWAKFRPLFRGRGFVPLKYLFSSQNSPKANENEKKFNDSRN
jgi:hypothetical protein